MTTPVTWILAPGQPWLPFTPPLDTPTAEPSTPATAAPRPRRIVSVSRAAYGTTHYIDAVADDGTAWWKVPGEVEWTQLPALPMREDDPAAGKVP